MPGVARFLHPHAREPEDGSTSLSGGHGRQSRLQVLPPPGLIAARIEANPGFLVLRRRVTEILLAQSHHLGHTFL